MMPYNAVINQPSLLKHAFNVCFQLYLTKQACMDLAAMHAGSECDQQPQRLQQQKKTEMLREDVKAESAVEEPAVPRIGGVDSRRSDLVDCCISSGCDRSTASELLAALHFADNATIQQLLVEPAAMLGMVSLLSSSCNDVEQSAAQALEQCAAWHQSVQQKDGVMQPASAALMQLLSSSIQGSQQAAADALAILGEQVSWLP
jgi:hypothetical protein